MSLEKYAATLTAQMSKNLQNSSASAPTRTQLQSFPMIQAEVHSVIDNSHVGFLMSFIQSLRRFYQVRLYAKESEFQDGLSTLKEITNSLVELGRQEEK